MTSPYAQILLLQHLVLGVQDVRGFSSTMCNCADIHSWIDSGQAGVCVHSGQRIHYISLPDSGDTGDLSFKLWNCHCLRQLAIQPRSVALLVMSMCICLFKNKCERLASTGRRGFCECFVSDPAWILQDMLWSVLPGLERGGCHRQPRKSVATAVRLLLFAVGCCIAFAVRPGASSVLDPSP